MAIPLLVVVVLLKVSFNYKYKFSEERVQNKENYTKKERVTHEGFSPRSRLL
ncbi:hypothetical protein HPL003_11295 [Paenibacillus terrae HPL-003]|uniref:Uncharacterized protein n=1 Tax=Paenibacillus terrae (strain HPL-003) TaxID=985665 RepID=G7VYM6_PAETH|nr:hypothetical protein HPL003_11295 [Paenibacillus terrae HPL-003]